MHEYCATLFHDHITHARAGCLGAEYVASRPKDATNHVRLVFLVMLMVVQHLDTVVTTQVT